MLCGACLRAIACELFVDMADISEQIAAAKAEVEKLKEEIRRVRENLDDTNRTLQRRKQYEGERECERELCARVPASVCACA